MGGIIIGTEIIAKVVVRCTIYEEMYLSTKKSPNCDAIEESLIVLYSDVLKFLAHSTRYLAHNTAGKFRSGCHLLCIMLMS